MNIVILRKNKPGMDKFEYPAGDNQLTNRWYTGSPYEARKFIFETALAAGFSKLIIISGGVQLIHKPHWNGHGAQTLPYCIEDTQYNGLWNYIDRLLDRYGHVYVPPLGWVGHHLNSPTLPMVAGYRMSALQEVSDLGCGVGDALTRHGYDSFTLSDYFFRNHGADILDEVGTATSWSKNYERAINRLA